MFQMLMGLSAGVGIGLVALALTTGLGYAALRLVVNVMARRLKLPQ